MKIAHLSDIHFGRISLPHIVEDLERDVAEAEVSLVVVSGDLTQRARREQFRQARALLDRFTAPVLVVPGNHDVFAWWHRPLSRLFDPLRKYRRYITEELSPTFTAPGLAVLGINTAYGLTIKGGFVDAATRQRIRDFFAAQPEGVFRVLVGHHHLTRLEALGRHDVALRAQATLAALEDAGVDLYLCGHLHIPHIEPITILPGTHRLVVASAGTATSDRGRKAHRDTNYYNLVTVDPGSFQIEERRYLPEARRFERLAVTTFPRQGG